jgi:hypothetical protein
MFGILAKLKGLLTDDNVRYLDVLLKALTQPKGSPVYNDLWTWFGDRFKSTPMARQAAWGALKKLHQIVQEYRRSRGI